MWLSQPGTRRYQFGLWAATELQYATFNALMSHMGIYVGNFTLAIADRAAGTGSVDDLHGVFRVRVNHCSRFHVSPWREIEGYSVQVFFVLGADWRDPLWHPCSVVGTRPLLVHIRKTKSAENKLSQYVRSDIEEILYECGIGDPINLDWLLSWSQCIHSGNDFLQFDRGIYEGTHGTRLVFHKSDQGGKLLGRQEVIRRNTSPLLAISTAFPSHFETADRAATAPHYDPNDILFSGQLIENPTAPGPDPSAPK